ncbi:hypothetical protein PM3016_6792 [Paenibacillus mucilaginosus 3016]|uniref:Uncharacterized protein n=2 Tax=Paenibacillus mucilaginosus TaxID=61624 RepID=H6NPP0_9BACL|nr:hypothetical protein [Paenibacillus mucilaginosus]AFC33396.1 hypothetical protein PM3016_6792 [Paenibacillus mucilaginosus 3016]AFH65707.1 hypothetical protein B2K_34250 [Paenibacillus mucilaginosus K02]WFA21807.1 hypothetical protein ERY13_33725 [Paenibacillus mucilaginosus]
MILHLFVTLLDQRKRLMQGIRSGSDEGRGAAAAYELEKVEGELARRFRQYFGRTLVLPGRGRGGLQTEAARLGRQQYTLRLPRAGRHLRPAAASLRQ